MFLTYKAHYIHIFLKPLATTHLLGIKATTVTLNFYIEFNLKQKISGNMIHYATDNEREKQKVISKHKLLNYLHGKQMDTSHFKHLLLRFMAAGSLLFWQFVSTAHNVHVNRSLSCREHNDGSRSLDLYFTTHPDPPKTVEPENEILLSIPHTKVIPNCDFRRCSIFPNNCAPNKQSEM